MYSYCSNSGCTCRYQIKHTGMPKSNMRCSRGYNAAVLPHGVSSERRGGDTHKTRGKCKGAGMYTGSDGRADGKWGSGSRAQSSGWKAPGQCRPRRLARPGFTACCRLLGGGVCRHVDHKSVDRLAGARRGIARLGLGRRRRRRGRGAIHVETLAGVVGGGGGPQHGPRGLQAQQGGWAHEGEEVIDDLRREGGQGGGGGRMGFKPCLDGGAAQGVRRSRGSQRKALSQPHRTSSPPAHPGAPGGPEGALQLALRVVGARARVAPQRLELGALPGGRPGAGVGVGGKVPGEETLQLEQGRLEDQAGVLLVAAPVWKGGRRLWEGRGWKARAAQVGRRRRRRAESSSEGRQSKAAEQAHGRPKRSKRTGPGSASSSGRCNRRAGRRAQPGRQR